MAASSYCNPINILNGEMMITSNNTTTSSFTDLNINGTTNDTTNCVSFDSTTTTTINASLGNNFNKNNKKKRKHRDHTTSCLISLPKDIKGEANNNYKEGDHQKKAKANEEGFVHVRARRGQATDSHSLAERVRREKISERMKLLQGLVPGCDKVIGKALMLDEIINYVQSLQHQVQFLSMKLVASMNHPMLKNLISVDPYTSYMITHHHDQELLVHQDNQTTQLTAFQDTTNSYRMIQCPTDFHDQDDNDSSLMEMSEVFLNNMCCFN